MTTRMNGFRKRTRHKFKKNQADKGKLSIRKFLQTFEVGDKVALSVDPTYQKGMYRPKFMGLIGEVVSVRGTCYNVAIKDINKKKVVIVHPSHLIKQ